jgi:hypothetical protein
MIIMMSLSVTLNVTTPETRYAANVCSVCMLYQIHHELLCELAQNLLSAFHRTLRQTNFMFKSAVNQLNHKNGNSQRRREEVSIRAR